MPPGARAKATPVKVNAQQRAAKALELRKGGATFDQIAQQLGYAGRGKAFEAIQAALREVTREPAEELLELELQRLDALQNGLWPKASRGDTKSVDSTLRVMERRHKLLGLDDFEARIAAVEEGKLALAEDQAAVVAQGIRRILDRLDLSPAQQALVGTVVPEELRALTAGAA